MGHEVSICDHPVGTGGTIHQVCQSRKLQGRRDSVLSDLASWNEGPSCVLLFQMTTLEFLINFNPGFTQLEASLVILCEWWCGGRSPRR